MEYSEGTGPVCCTTPGQGSRQGVARSCWQNPGATQDHGLVEALWFSVSQSFSNWFRSREIAVKKTF